MPVFSKGCSDVLYNHDITMISQNSVTFYMSIRMDCSITVQLLEPHQFSLGQTTLDAVAEQVRRQLQGQRTYFLP